MPTEHVDVLIVGAGLSGIGAACHLTEECPTKSYAIFESRDAMGGTWDLFRYPGIRSDSDMFTLGYRFRPWEAAEAIADGPSIREYINDTAREYGVNEHIRYHHKVVGAEWSSESSLWTVTAERTDTGDTVEVTCAWLYACTGYYRYDEGFTPEFPGVDRFPGEVIHPQHWPEDLDYTGKRVVVIGSGATAVTLVPAMADRAEHVTMLQRSPTYIVSLPGQDGLAKLLLRRLPAKVVYPIVRWKNVLRMQLSFALSRKWPKVMKTFIRKAQERELPPGYDIAQHFTPKYNPWDQRMCLVPDGDLFKAVTRGDASIFTDTIESFTEKGIKLTSGHEIEADIIVTATGLNLLPIGGLDLTVDGRRVELSETVGYKGMMFSGIPNMAVALGYTNASWTLKCDLTAEYVCRLLNHMDANGYAQATPVEPDPSLPREPFIDLKAGYVMRAIDKFPKQGPHEPWRLHQNYPRDIALIRRGSLEDEGMRFSSPAPAARRGEKLAA
jgi:cation diffusion facilitator CzcD-associated flavoprotein CzcO